MATGSPALAHDVVGGGLEMAFVNPSGCLTQAYRGTGMFSEPLPVRVVGLESGVAGLAAGGSHSCALRGEGGVRCWGWNADGRLGDGTFGERHLPVEVVGLGDKVTATPTPTPTPTPGPHTAIGDVDCDGVSMRSTRRWCFSSRRGCSAS